MNDLVTDGRAGVTLVEATDADFAWMMRGVAVSNRGLALPPGGVDASETLAHVRAIVRRLRELGCGNGAWMVVAHDEVVGLCGYKHPVSIAGEVEIGCGIAASRRRKGYATSAVSEILAQARKDPSIRYVVADTAVDNHASQGVLRRNGFEHIGELTDARDGELLIRWRADLRPFDA